MPNSIQPIKGLRAKDFVTDNQHKWTLTLDQRFKRSIDYNKFGGCWAESGCNPIDSVPVPYSLPALKMSSWLAKQRLLINCQVQKTDAMKVMFFLVDKSEM